MPTIPATSLLLGLIAVGLSSSCTGELKRSAGGSQETTYTGSGASSSDDSVPDGIMSGGGGGGNSSLPNAPGEPTPNTGGSPEVMLEPDDQDPTSSGGGNPVEPVPNCKRGVAYGDHSKADFAALSPGVSWWYNWSSRPDPDLRDGTYLAENVEYVPMVWGANFNVDALILDIPTGAEVLLGFNEPNFGDQSNISAAQAASLWPNLEQIAGARGLDLVSPAVNYCGNNCQDEDPYSYLDDFFAACPGCKVDAIAVHIYVGCNQNGDNKAEWLINIVEQYKERFSHPLWLTEFACTDAANFDEQIGFMRDALDYLEAEPRVERYAWFSGRFEQIPYINLLGGDGALTPLGQTYLTAPGARDCSR